MKKQNVGIITFPISGTVALSNLIDILYRLSDEIHLITGGAGYTFFMKNKKVHTYQVEHRTGTNAVFTRAINYAWTQLRISCKLMSLTRNVDLWIFFIGGEGLVLPMLTAKLLRKGVVIASAGSGLKVAQAQGDPLAKVSALLQGITYRLSDRIITQSERLIDEHGLQKYRNKICIAREHFLDFGKFRIQKALNKRNNVVSYIGRLGQEKGILNFVEAIPKLLEIRPDIRFLIGGDGQLRNKVEQYLDKETLRGKVNFVGWIPHNELPEYLNKVKLLVIPSYTEAGPLIAFEAMACGTPLLATAVGAIPDVIKDNKTGFIMEENSPECIARNVIRALSHPDLREIARNARALVEKEYTYEAAVEGYGNILASLK